jgi:hypothetical protein
MVAAHGDGPGVVRRGPGALIRRARPRAREHLWALAGDAAPDTGGQVRGAGIASAAQHLERLTVPDERIAVVIGHHGEHAQHDAVVIAGRTAALGGALRPDRRAFEEDRAGSCLHRADVGESPRLAAGRELPGLAAVSLAQDGVPDRLRARQYRSGRRAVLRGEGDHASGSAVKPYMIVIVRSSLRGVEHDQKCLRSCRVSSVARLALDWFPTCRSGVAKPARLVCPHVAFRPLCAVAVGAPPRVRA